MDEKYLTDAREWLSYAKDDLGVAKHLFETYHPKPLSIVCFHCQQAAEKAVKSVIVFHGNQGGMPKKHDILLLINQIRNMESIDEKFFDYADILAPYGVGMRYPNELVLEERHGRKAIDAAGEFVAWATHIVGTDSPTLCNSPTNRNL